MKKQNPVSTYLYEATYKNRISVIGLIFMEVTLSILQIAIALVMRYALDGAANRNMNALQFGLVCMTFFILLRIFFRAVLRYLDEKVRSSIENNLKGRLFHHLLRNDYAQTEAVHTGEWMNRLTSDTSVVADGITEILPNFFGMAVKLIGAAVMIIAMIPGISYLLLPTGIFVIFITWLLRKTMKKHHKAVQESDGLLRMFLQERLGSMMIVRAFRAEDTVEREATDRMAKHKATRIKRNIVSNLCNIGFAGLMNGLYIVSFAYCGYGIISSSITYGTLLAVIQLIGQIQTPFTRLSGIIPRFYSMTASAERLLEAECFAKEQTVVSIPETNFSNLTLENVGFSYPNGNRKPVLSELSVCIHKGDYVALTGHSGCGKSTLFKLLLCLYKPTDGKIDVSFQNGNVEPLDIVHRSLFAYVPQGNYLMSGTIREIVAFAEQDKTDTQRMMRALKIACADRFVLELKHGIDTVLGEHGAGLSEGQIQRLAIARAIYTDAPILLLDEATSALDENTEMQVLTNLKAMTNKTVLIVTHRPAAHKVCNRTLELHK